MIQDIDYSKINCISFFWLGRARVCILIYGLFSQRPFLNLANHIQETLVYLIGQN